MDEAISTSDFRKKKHGSTPRPYSHRIVDYTQKESESAFKIRSEKGNSAQKCAYFLGSLSSNVLVILPLNFGNLSKQLVFTRRFWIRFEEISPGCISQRARNRLSNQMFQIGKLSMQTPDVPNGKTEHAYRTTDECMPP